MIRELHLPSAAVAELEPARGDRRSGAGAGPSPVAPKQVAAFMAGLLLAVLVFGGAVGAPPAARSGPHHLAFDEPAPGTAGPDPAVGAGESAAGLGIAEPARPPDHIPDGWSWRPVGPLAGRQGNIALWTGTEAIYWGGDRPGRPPEGAAYDPKADRWRRLSRSPLTNRTGAAAAWTGREVLVFGGVNGAGPQRDGAAYDPATDRWRTLAPGPLSGRVPLAAAWTGTEFVVIGLRGPGLYDGTKDAAAYDPVSDTWRPLPELPLQLNDGAAVWTGRELIVYGTFLDRQRSLMSPDIRARGAALDPVAGHWRDLPPSPLRGQGMALVWDGEQAVGWDHGLNSAAFDPAASVWRSLPDVPLERRDCLPDGAMAGTVVFATHCGQAAEFSRKRLAWRAVPIPRTASEPPVWTGDGLVLWLGPSGRSNDGTWFRRLDP